MPRATPRRRADSSSRSSPRGHRTAARSRSRASGAERSQLYAMSPDGSGTRRLTSTKEEDGQPTWSPDGDRIAFARGAPSRLFVMNADGSGARRVTDEEVEEGRARVVAGRPLDRLRAEKPRLEHPRALAGAPGRLAAAPPDEARRRRSGAGVVAGRKAARVLRERGEQPLRHLHDRRSTGKDVRLMTSRDDSFEPAWSPDGKTIVFAEGGAIVAIDVANGDERGSPTPTTTTRARPGGAAPRERSRCRRSVSTRRPTRVRDLPVPEVPYCS